MARHYLTQLRERSGLGPFEMAERLGIPYREYDQLERGQLKIRTDSALMARISAAVELPVQCILQQEIDWEKASCF